MSALASLTAVGQPWLLDPDFPHGNGPDHYVRSIAVQNDGRILIGGNFTNFNGTLSPGLTRLLVDGSIDPSLRLLAPPGQPVPRVSRVAAHPDGRIVVSGTFDSVSGTAVTNIAVLRHDGGVDTDFQPPTILPRGSVLSTLIPAHDGGFWATGTFTNLGEHFSPRLARLKPNGVVDPSFRSPFNGSNQTIWSILPLTNGHVLVSGTFIEGQGPAAQLIQLKPSGEIDPEFVAEIPASTTRLSRMTELPGGGSIAEISSVPLGLSTDAPRSLVRWTAKGRLDQAFTPNFTYSGSSLQSYSRILALCPQSEGHLIASGTFLEVNGIQRLNLVRLNPDGSTDLCFDPGLGAESLVLALAIEKSGGVLIGGAFRNVEGQDRPFLARLRPSSQCGASGTFAFTSGAFRANERSPSALISVRRDGSVDETQTVRVSTSSGTASAGDDYLAVDLRLQFAPGERIRSLAIPLIPDALAEGDETLQLNLSTSPFDTTDATALLTIGDEAASLAAGQPDTNFLAQLDAPISAGAVLRSGDLVLAVSPLEASGYGGYGAELRRLKATASLDTLFVRTNLFDGPIEVVRELPDGRLLVGGDFVHINGMSRPGLARLFPDGRLDEAYAPFQASGPEHLGIGPSVTDLHIEGDGSVVCSGAFPITDGSPWRRPIARVLFNGTTDHVFNNAVPSGVQRATRLLALNDGSWLAGISGSSVTLARFFRDGTRDPRFLPQAYTPLSAETLAITPDQHIIAGGSTFPELGLKRPAVVRLAPNGGTVDLFHANAHPWIDPGLSSIWRALTDVHGRVVLAGSFGAMSEPSKTTLLRLHADGTWDPSFDAGTGAEPRRSPLPHAELIRSQIRFLESLSDGSIVVGGDFAGFNGLDQPYLVKLGSGVPISSQFRLSRDNLTVAESELTAHLQLVRVGDLSEAVQAIVRTEPITAIEGHDFYSVRRTLMFAPGEWRHSFSVELINNDLFQTNRAFRVAVESLTQSVAVGTPSSSVITILDDDVNVEFATNMMSAREEDGFVMIPIRRAGNAGEALEVEVFANGNFAPAIVRFEAMPAATTVTNLAKLIIPDDPVQNPPLQLTLHLRVRTGDASLGTAATTLLRVSDNDFAHSPGRGVAGLVHTITAAPNGGVYVGGNFSAVHGTARRSIARLNADGEVDNSFDPASGPNGSVTALAVQPDTKLLVTGDFSHINGIARARIARLNPDGTLDNSFDPGWSATSKRSIVEILCVAVVTNGQVLVGGVFESFGGHRTHGVARLMNNGRVDLAFHSPLTERQDTIRSSPFTHTLSRVNEVHPAGNGKVAVIGDLFYPNRGGWLGPPVAAVSVVLLRDNGDIDLTFPPRGWLQPILSLVPLPDGAFLVGSAHPNVQSGLPRTRETNWVSIERLRPNGQLDPGFSVRNVPDFEVDAASVHQLLLQEDGSILFLADIRTEGLRSRHGLSFVGKLRPDGQWDHTFSPAVATNTSGSTLLTGFAFNDVENRPGTNFTAGAIASVARQTDGVIVLAGTFDDIDHEPRHRLARLNPNGSLRGRLALEVGFAPNGELRVITEPEIPVPFAVEYSENLESWLLLGTNETPWTRLQLQFPRDPLRAQEYFRLCPTR